MSAMVRHIKYLIQDVGEKVIMAIRRRGCVGAKYVHEKWVAWERVEVHLHPSNIADELQRQTAEHGAENGPGAMADAEEDLQDQQDAENNGKEGIPGEGRDIREGTLDQGTRLQSTEVIWDRVVGRDTGWHRGDELGVSMQWALHRGAQSMGTRLQK